MTIGSIARVGKNHDKSFNDMLAAMELIVSQEEVGWYKAGESFVSKGGTRMDWSAKENKVAIGGNTVSEYLDLLDAQYDNFPIKGYAVTKK